MKVFPSGGLRPAVKQTAETQRALGSRGGWLLMALLTDTPQIDGWGLFGR